MMGAGDVLCLRVPVCIMKFVGEHSFDCNTQIVSRCVTPQRKQYAKSHSITPPTKQKVDDAVA